MYRVVRSLSHIIIECVISVDTAGLACCGSPPVITLRKCDDAVSVSKDRHLCSTVIASSGSWR